MSTSQDPIAELAYTELAIACQKPGCGSIFELSLEVPATDPVETWAVEMARRAREAGWGAGSYGTVQCPVHREGRPSN